MFEKLEDAITTIEEVGNKCRPSEQRRMVETCFLRLLSWVRLPLKKFLFFHGLFSRLLLVRNRLSKGASDTCNSEEFGARSLPPLDFSRLERIISGMDGNDKPLTWICWGLWVCRMGIKHPPPVGGGCFCGCDLLHNCGRTQFAPAYRSSSGALRHLLRLRGRFLGRCSAQCQQYRLHAVYCG